MTDDTVPQEYVVVPRRGECSHPMCNKLSENDPLNQYIADQNETIKNLEETAVQLYSKGPEYFHKHILRDLNDVINPGLDKHKKFIDALQVHVGVLAKTHIGWHYEFRTFCAAVRTIAIERDELESRVCECDKYIKMLEASMLELTHGKPRSMEGNQSDADRVRALLSELDLLIEKCAEQVKTIENQKAELHVLKDQLPDRDYHHWLSNADAVQHLNELLVVKKEFLTFKTEAVDKLQLAADEKLELEAKISALQQQVTEFQKPDITAFKWEPIARALLTHLKAQAEAIEAQAATIKSLKPAVD